MIDTVSTLQQVQQVRLILTDCETKIQDAAKKKEMQKMIGYSKTR